MTMARYKLKRPVEIAVQHMPERWAGRCLSPPHYIATIVAGGPRSMRDNVAQGRTRDAAVQAMIRHLQMAGYTGRLRIEHGGHARRPWG